MAHDRGDENASIRLRLGTPDDRDALAAGFERFSPASRAARFFTGVPELTGHMLDHLVDVDPAHHVAVVADDMSRTSDVDGHEPGLAVGVARYVVSSTNPTTAELAVAVIDEYQGRGIGRLLIEALVDHAVGSGIRTLTASVLGDNVRMLHLLTSMGATHQRDPDDRTVVSFELALPAE